MKSLHIIQKIAYVPVIIELKYAHGNVKYSYSANNLLCQIVTKTPWIQWLTGTPGDPAHSSTESYNLLQQMDTKKDEKPHM